ncbi:MULTISPECIES: phage tail sheath subtilisin-like domain-containing protein [Paenibacillus]|uniref:phage tail sheath subtilisin-like domain-containing protein n=1 Tax=Paenibacillus TaxID=44249 RepID=UPI000CF8EC11|nr:MULTISPECIES: phage tail sheath subtilisin-like domain-containing protein [Paenibacillus]MBJ9987395.1 phage tail sheath subtilisin-like domain-containing protein [Paenibacillus sp. S28]PQP89054.1 phage tail sheath protein [Paenibacillus sp. AR247]
MGGAWDPISLPVRPGLYINFVEAAAAQIKGGARGTVALPLFQYAGAEAGKFYTIEKEAEAIQLFGAEAVGPIRLILQGGAKEVLVYTVPPVEGNVTPAVYTSIRDVFGSRPFNVFVYPDEVPAEERKAAQLWCKDNREDEGKHFMTVFGGSLEDDLDPAVGNKRSTDLADEYAVNLITGVEIGGTAYSSARYAPYIAGLIAGTGINKSITYTPVIATDVVKRLKNSEINASLQKGSLVLVHDGEKVKVEQGLVTGKKKIRAMRARQAISTDIPKAAAEAYIGRLDNNADGQAALISAVKAYLERLELNNVLTDIVVTLDPDRHSEGDSVFLLIGFTEIDSMERIFLTIKV